MVFTFEEEFIRADDSSALAVDLSSVVELECSVLLIFRSLAGELSGFGIGDAG